VTDVGLAHQQKTQTYELAATLCCAVRKGLRKGKERRKQEMRIMKRICWIGYYIVKSMKIDIL